MTPASPLFAWLARWLLCAGLALFAGCDLVVASLTHACVYSEIALPAPDEMVNAEFMVEVSAFQGMGQDANYACLKDLGSLRHHIVGPEVNISQTVRTWYEKQGLRIEPLQQGAKFQLVRYVALVKHGLATVDSGRGPFYFMVLKDPEGALFLVSVSSLGINLDDRFLSIKWPGVAAALINHKNFDTASDAGHPRIQFRRPEPLLQGKERSGTRFDTPLMPPTRAVP